MRTHIYKYIKNFTYWPNLTFKKEKKKKSIHLTNPPKSNLKHGLHLIRLGWNHGLKAQYEINSQQRLISKQ